MEASQVANCTNALRLALPRSFKSLPPEPVVVQTVAPATWGSDRGIQGGASGRITTLPADRGPCTLVSPRCGGRQGQQIVAINGVDVATMTQQEHCHRGAWHLRCQLQRSDTACTVPCTLQEFRAALKARPLTLRQFGQSRLLQFLMSSCCGAGSESPTILRRHAV